MCAFVKYEGASDVKVEKAAPNVRGIVVKSWRITAVLLSPTALLCTRCD